MGLDLGRTGQSGSQDGTTFKSTTRPVTSDHERYVLDVIAGIEAQNLVFYGQRIAVVRDPEEEVSKGGIIIPDEAKRKEPRGTVVGVGLGVDIDDDVVSGLRVGDRVMFTKYNPIQFNITLPDGAVAKLDLMHVSDLYIGWRE
jgi:chaperonin GroES